MEMEKIGRCIYELKKLGAGDQQCEDCLHSQFPNMGSIDVCKKCISDTPAFTALVICLMAHANGMPSNA